MENTIFLWVEERMAEIKSSDALAGARSAETEEPEKHR